MVCGRNGNTDMVNTSDNQIELNVVERFGIYSAFNILEASL